VSAVAPLVAFYDVPGRRGEVLFFSSVPDIVQEFDGLAMKTSQTDSIQTILAEMPYSTLSILCLTLSLL
jgi:hypothetical protein